MSGKNFVKFYPERERERETEVQANADGDGEEEGLGEAEGCIKFRNGVFWVAYGAATKAVHDVAGQKDDDAKDQHEAALLPAEGLVEGLGHDVEPGDLNEDDERRGGVVEILVGLLLLLASKKSRHLAEVVIGAANELRQRVERNATKGGGHRDRTKGDNGMGG